MRSRNINSEDNFAVFDKTDLSCNATWKLNNNSVYNNILKLESFESKLEDFNIKNGLATLKNDIYFFKVIKENEKYYYRYYNGKEYGIEKDICINIIKHNYLKWLKKTAKKIQLNRNINRGFRM